MTELVVQDEIVRGFTDVLIFSNVLVLVVVAVFLNIERLRSGAAWIRARLRAAWASRASVFGSSRRVAAHGAH